MKTPFQNIYLYANIHKTFGNMSSPVTADSHFMRVFGNMFPNLVTAKPDAKPGVSWMFYLNNILPISNHLSTTIRGSVIAGGTYIGLAGVIKSTVRGMYSDILDSPFSNLYITILIKEVVSRLNGGKSYCELLEEAGGSGWLLAESLEDDPSVRPGSVKPVKVRAWNGAGTLFRGFAPAFSVGTMYGSWLPDVVIADAADKCSRCTCIVFFHPNGITVMKMGGLFPFRVRAPSGEWIYFTDKWVTHFFRDARVLQLEILVDDTKRSGCFIGFEHSTFEEDPSFHQSLLVDPCVNPYIISWLKSYIRVGAGAKWFGVPMRSYIEYFDLVSEHQRLVSDAESLMIDAEDMLLLADKLAAEAIDSKDDTEYKAKEDEAERAKASGKDLEQRAIDAGKAAKDKAAQIEAHKKEILALIAANSDLVKALTSAIQLEALKAREAFEARNPSK